MFEMPRAGRNTKNYIEGYDTFVGVYLLKGFRCWEDL